tara:strand:- start:1176 stop:1403 length:228 start_codon:yes stop_codon:yes gene_type:complete
MDDVQRDLGRMEAQLEAMTTVITDVRMELRQVSANQAAMKADFDQVKGGWRVLIGVAAVIGGAVSWITSKIFSGH